MAFYNEIPQYTTLTTTHCDNFNEVNQKLLENTLQNHQHIGDISSLSTTKKDSLVSAVNEVKQSIPSSTNINQTIDQKISTHNQNNDSHQDIRNKIQILSNDRGYLNSFISGADLNTFTQNGMYSYSQDSANRPSQTYGYLFVSDWGSGFCRQFVQDNNNSCFTRVMSNNTWSHWKQIATEEQINVLSDQIIWKPNKWKSESDLPNKYPIKSVTRFNTGDDSWNGRSWGIIETTVGASYGSGGIIQKWYGTDNSPIYYRTSNGNGDAWFDWKEIATTTKLDIPFPFTGNYTSRGGYTSKVIKDSIGLVTINVTFQINDGSTPLPQGNNIIGTLPVGYRPQGIVAGVGSTAFGGAMVNVRVTVGSDGVVTCTTGNGYTSSNVIGFSISYYV